MPEHVERTPPEKLRLLRLRHNLEQSALELADAVLETHVSDTFAIALLNAANEVKRALAIVVGSLQAFDEADSEVVE